ncbi:MAG: N-acetylmuramoyl-L-alanine amidase [Candidatus Omnitrophica bacterium]|nr:N-acetylmuramoyl-L-alanine amidase [Candidatus Omnitrophota bacterium]
MKKFMLSFVLIGFLVWMGGCASVPLTHNMGQGISLQEICKKYSIYWQFDSVTQVVLLEVKSHKAKAVVGSPVVFIGQEKITLDGPLRRVNSSIYVPEDFESKVIGSLGLVQSNLGYSGEISNLKVRTIILDPGHGGKDPGAKGYSGVKEKDVVLDIGKRLKSLLTQSGIKVVMTRDNDEFISLNGRTEMATKANADLFVSIHANSNPARRTEGIEVYYAKTHEKRDLDEDQRQKNEKNFLRNLDADRGSTVGAIVADMMYQLKICESSKLAMRIVHDCSAAVETPNRGARHARYFVVRNTLMPAILVETGFLTNKKEEKRLNTKEYRQKLAESIARSILTYASSS